MTAFEEHCQRVSALSVELGRHANLSEGPLRVLAQAGLIHHDENATAGRATGRLAAWLNTPGEPAAPISNEVVRALRIFRGDEDCAADADAARLAEILRVANDFDEMLEFRRFEPRPTAELVAEIAEMDGFLKSSGAAAKHLADLSRDRMPDILAASDRLPASAIAVIRNLMRVPSHQVTVTALKTAAESDPALAADVLRAVNSAVQSPHQRLSSLGQAIQYLGTATAQKVLIESAMRILCASSTVRSMWQHCLCVAADARSMAEYLDLDTNVAYLAGLVHDIGRLAMECLHGETADAYQRLRQCKVPAVWAEWVALHHDHAEIGAMLMESWGASQPLIEAIRLHHRPESSESQLASILYLAEIRNDDRECETAPGRLVYALDVCGLSQAELSRLGPSRRGLRVAM